MELCNECNKKKSCVKLCPRAREYADIDHIKRNGNEMLNCDRGIDIDEIIIKDYPEGEIDLNIEDWKYFIKHYEMTRKQKRYIFLKYWKHLSYRDIGKKCSVDSSSVIRTIKRFLEKKTVISL